MSEQPASAASAAPAAGGILEVVGPVDAPADSELIRA